VWGQSLTTKPELGLIKPQVMAVHDELSSNWLHNQASNLLFFFFGGRGRRSISILFFVVVQLL
jgi:hypothetical protein